MSTYRFHPRVKVKTEGQPVSMNKLEMAYGKHLDLQKFAGVVSSWAFNAVRFHLGGGAWYKPDFLVITSEGWVELHETKGHWREAARVRIKVAAQAFPGFRFVAVTRSGRAWVFEEILPQ